MDQFALSAVSANSTIPKPLHSFLPPIHIGCTSVVKGSGKVRDGHKGVSRGKVLRLHTVFGVLTQSEDLVSSLRSIYSSTGS